jgi:hypothetical protein
MICPSIQWVNDISKKRQRRLMAVNYYVNQLTQDRLKTKERRFLSEQEL